MKHIFKYAVAGLFLAGVSSCTNLDEELVDRYTETFDPQNKPVGIRDNVNTLPPDDGLGGAFQKLLDGSATNGGFFAVQEGGTDEAVITQKGGDWYDGGLYIRMHHHEFSPQTWAINDAWNNAYTGIFQCNDLLKEKDGTGVTTPAVFENTLGPAATAQLRGLRAYFYWRLLDIFGNVPISVAAGKSGPQKQRAEVYAFVEKELLEAIPGLPDGRQQYARLSKYGAYALLARLYLNAKEYKGSPEYQKAIDAADKVITSGVYSLQERYSDAFGPKNSLPDSSKEHIFIIPYDENTGKGAIWPMMTLHYPSQLTYKLSDQPWNGFSSIEEFYKSYEDTDLRRKASFITGPQYDKPLNDPSKQQILDLAFDKADHDGPGVNYTPFINELAPNASRQGGARFGKFRIKYGAYNDQDNDMPVLRYAEVLLNKAEALCRLHNDFNDGQAVALVDAIRTRAGVGTIAPMNAGKLLAERGRELFVEGHRRTDLIRFDTYDDAWWEKTPDPKGEQHKIMAIPFDQIQAANTTDFKLTQNTGY